MNKDIGAEEMIEIWALRSVGGSLKSPYRISTGGEVGFDDERYVALYVELVPGFRIARPALLRHHMKMKLVGDWWKLPGLSLLRSAVKLGWGPLYMSTRPGPTWIPYRVYWEFVAAVEARMKDKPLAFPSRVELETVETIVAEVDAIGAEVRSW